MIRSCVIHLVFNRQLDLRRINEFTITIFDSKKIVTLDDHNLFIIPEKNKTE